MAELKLGITGNQNSDGESVTEEAELGAGPVNVDAQVTEAAGKGVTEQVNATIELAKNVEAEMTATNGPGGKAFSGGFKIGF